MGVSAGAPGDDAGGTDSADAMEGDGGNPEQPSKVQAVVSYVGPVNLAGGNYTPTQVQILTAFLGGNPNEMQAECRSASPITYLNKGDAPTLCFFGTKDPLIAYDQASQIATALTNSGVPGRVEIILGAGHGWVGKELTRTERHAGVLRRAFEEVAIWSGSAKRWGLGFPRGQRGDSNVRVGGRWSLALFVGGCGSQNLQQAVVAIKPLHDAAVGQLQHNDVEDHFVHDSPVRDVIDRDGFTGEQAVVFDDPACPLVVRADSRFSRPTARVARQIEIMNQSETSHTCEGPLINSILDRWVHRNCDGNSPRRGPHPPYAVVRRNCSTTRPFLRLITGLASSILARPGPPFLQIGVVVAFDHVAELAGVGGGGLGFLVEHVGDVDGVIGVIRVEEEGHRRVVVLKPFALQLGEVEPPGGGAHGVGRDHRAAAMVALVPLLVGGARDRSTARRRACGGESRATCLVSSRRSTYSSMPSSCPSQVM